MSDDVNAIISLISAAAKDYFIEEAIEQLREAHCQLAETEARCRREISSQLILDAARIDAAIKKFEMQFARIADGVSAESRQRVYGFVDSLRSRKEALLIEKNNLKKKLPSFLE